ncbi:AraC family ligand binding domain-containing protein, partial [Streptococcus gallolyticus]
MTNNVPRLENTASLALFYKKGVKDKVLYTNVQEEKIQYFIAENYDQMHQNTAFELLYVLSGTVINKIEDKEFIYHAGQGCLLNRRITHSDILKNGHLLVLNISEDILKEVLLPLKSTPEIQGKIFQFLLSNLQGEDDWMRSYIEFSPCAPVDNP